MAVVAVRSASVQALLDVAVPVLLAVLTLVQLLTEEPRANTALVTVCALAAVLPLAARRRAPLAVTLVVSAGVVGQVVASDGAPATFASFVAVMICVYTLLRHAGPRSVAAGLAVVAVAVASTAVAGGTDGALPAVRGRLSAVLLRGGRGPRGVRPAARAAPDGGRGPRRGAGRASWSARRSSPRRRSGPGSRASCTTSSRTG